MDKIDPGKPKYWGPRKPIDIEKIEALQRTPAAVTENGTEPVSRERRREKHMLLVLAELNKVEPRELRHRELDNFIAGFVEARGYPELAEAYRESVLAWNA